MSFDLNFLLDILTSKGWAPAVYLLFFFLACGGYIFVIISIDYHGSG